MQVFNAFFKILKSKLFLMFMYIPVFVAVSIGLAFSDDNTSSAFEQERLHICVFDEDGTSESRALTVFLGKKNDLVTLENDRDTVIDALYYRRVDYVLTIKSGYAAKLAAGDTDGLFGSMHMHDSYSTVYMGQMLNEYAGTVSAYIAGGNDVMTAVGKAEEALLKEADVTVAKFDENSGGVFTGKASIYFRFLVYVVIGLTMSTLCPILLSMNKKDVRYRTNCSGIHPNSYTLQIIGGCVILVFAMWAVLMVVGMFMNGGMYEGLQWLGVLNSFVFMIFAAMLTIFVSSFEPGKTVVNIITQVIAIGMCFTCGVFIEQDLLGEGVLAASKFMPAYWYIRVNRMLEGTEIFDAGLAATSILIEAGFAAVFAILTVVIRRARYSSAAVRTAA